LNKNIQREGQLCLHKRPFQAAVERLNTFKSARRTQAFHVSMFWCTVWCFLHTCSSSTGLLYPYLL